jgi:hypothetical protein
VTDSQGGTPAAPRPDNAEFLRGATAVLAHIKMFDGAAGGTLYNECVRFIGAKSLIAQARRDGAMRWSGLDTYVRYHKDTV